jgi:tryptophan-rich sensory protein
MNTYNKLKKSKLTPSPIVFKIVWPILYLTLLISLISIMKLSKTSCTIIFFVQLILNLIWTTLFFKKKMYWVSFFDIIGMILLTYGLIYRCEQKILYPYLVWISFALYLNGYIALKNIIL